MPDPTVLCFPNLNGSLSNLVTTTGQTVSATGMLGSSMLGELDRTWTTTNSFGGSVQAASSEKVFGHENNSTPRAQHRPRVGPILDDQRAWNSQRQSVSICPGQRLFIDQPSGDVAPVGLGATTLYTGLYATDTFDVTPRLSYRGRPVQFRPDHVDR